MCNGRVCYVGVFCVSCCVGVLCCVCCVVLVCCVGVCVLCVICVTKRHVVLPFAP